MLAVVCPGQGAQSPGMLAPWLELPGTADRLGAYADVVGQNLVAHGTTNSKEQRLKCSATSRCGRTTARARAFHAAIDKPQELGWIV